MADAASISSCTSQLIKHFFAATLAVACWLATGLVWASPPPSSESSERSNRFEERNAKIAAKPPPPTPSDIAQLSCLEARIEVAKTGMCDSDEYGDRLNISYRECLPKWSVGWKRIDAKAKEICSAEKQSKAKQAAVSWDQVTNKEATFWTADELKQQQSLFAKLCSDDVNDGRCLQFGSRISIAANAIAIQQAYEEERAQKNVPPNPLVREAQRLLSKVGYQPGLADGYLTETTRRAIRSFQNENNLPVTGVVSRQLLRALRDRATSGWVDLPGGETSKIQYEEFEQVTKKMGDEQFQQHIDDFYAVSGKGGDVSESIDEFERDILNYRKFERERVARIEQDRKKRLMPETQATNRKKEHQVSQNEGTHSKKVTSKKPRSPNTSRKQPLNCIVIKNQMWFNQCSEKLMLLGCSRHEDTSWDCRCDVWTHPSQGSLGVVVSPGVKMLMWQCRPVDQPCIRETERQCWDMKGTKNDKYYNESRRY